MTAPHDGHMWVYVAGTPQPCSGIDCGVTTCGWCRTCAVPLCLNCFDGHPVTAPREPRRVTVSEMAGAFEGGPDSVGWLRDQRGGGFCTGCGSTLLPDADGRCAACGAQGA